MEEVFQYLSDRNIAFVKHTHPPVYTVEEANKYRNGIKGIHCKNLFLIDSKRKQFYLLTVPADKSIRLNRIRKKIKAKKLSFADEESLMSTLNLEPGSVSPLGLINDQQNLTIFIIDEEVWSSDRVTFHPNINTMTIEITGSDFQKLVKSFNNEYTIIEIKEYKVSS